MATSDSKPNPEQIKIVTWNPKSSCVDLEDKFSELLCYRIPKAFLCEQEVRDKTVLNTSTSKDGKLDDSFSKEPGKKTNRGQVVLILGSESVGDTDWEGSEIPPDAYDLSKLRCSGKCVYKEDIEKSFILVSFHGEKNRKQGNTSHLSNGEKNDKLKSFNHTQEDPDCLSDSVHVSINMYKLELFINEMRKLANVYELVVIVGGDFKYEIIDWKTNIEVKYGGQVVVAPLYAGVPNRRHAKNVTDTFIAVYPDDRKNVPTCKFHTPIPICMLPTTGYVGDDETEFVNYPNDVHPCCKVLYYSHKELQELKTTILNASKEKPDFEESYKDNKTDAILPLWPECKILKSFSCDPVMVTVELHWSTKDEESPSEEQVSV